MKTIINEDVISLQNEKFPHWKSLTPEVYPYRATFLFVTFYYLIAHGRLHLVVPVLASIPCAMISGVLAVVAFQMESGRQHSAKYQLIREEKLLIGLVLMCIITLPTSVWPGGSVTTLTRGFLPAIILTFITGIICKTNDDIKKIVWVYIFNSALIIGVSLKSGLNHFSKGVTDTYDVNDIAMVLDCALPIMFFCMRNNRGIKKIILIACCVLAILTVVYTASRGGLLGLLAFAGYLVLTSQNKIRYFIAVGIAAVIFAVYAPEETKARFASMYNPQTEYDKNMGDRKQVWSNGVSLFFDAPILGVGLGNYKVADGSTKESGGWKTAHNSLLQIAVELGIVGLVLYIKLIVGTFFKLRRLSKELGILDPAPDVLWILRGAEASLLVYMITAFFLSQAYNTQFYFIIALAIAAQKILANDRLNYVVINSDIDQKETKQVSAHQNAVGSRRI